VRPSSLLALLAMSIVVIFPRRCLLGLVLMLRLSTTLLLRLRSSERAPLIAIRARLLVLLRPISSRRLLSRRAWLLALLLRSLPNLRPRRRIIRLIILRQRRRLSGLTRLLLWLLMLRRSMRWRGLPHFFSHLMPRLRPCLYWWPLLLNRCTRHRRRRRRLIDDRIIEEIERIDLRFHNWLRLSCYHRLVKRWILKDIEADIICVIDITK
jgi:hypothetical protein